MTRPAQRWPLWVAVLGVVTVAMLAVRTRLDKAHVALAFLLVVLGASADAGRALGFTVAAVAFLAFNYLFLPPFHTLLVAEPIDWIVLVAFLVTSAVATQLLYRATATAEAATQRADEIDRLAALGAETLSAPGAEQALQAIVDVIRDAIDADTCEVFRRGAEGTLLRVAHATRDAASDVATDAAETPPEAAARRVVGPGSLLRWSADHGRSAVELSDGTIRLAPEEEGDAADADAGATRPDVAAHPALSSITHAIDAGRLGSVRHAIRPPGADAEAGLVGGLRRAMRAGEREAGTRAGSEPAVHALLLPLVVRQHPVGVLRVAARAGVALSPEQARLLVALASYAALGVERVRLVESAERAEAERRLESLRSALLTAVSHDLRTPLTTIKGIAHEVAHGADASRAAVIEAEADRLNDMIADLLDLSRIQAGAVRPAIAVNTVDDLVGAALERAAGALRDRSVAVELPEGDVLAGRFDFTQALRVLVNLLENAAKYAPCEAPIGLRVRRDGARLLIAVSDAGPGVPPSERERIFDPFYRPPDTPSDVRGTGLGLSIARGLAEAQGGHVRYEPRDGGGSTFVLELPATDPLPPDDEPPAGAGR